MFGWFSDAPSLASRSKRRPASSGLSACSRLIATLRPSCSSSARTTTAMPPAPRRPRTRYRSARSCLLASGIELGLHRGALVRVLEALLEHRHGVVGAPGAQEGVPEVEERVGVVDVARRGGA